MSLRRLNARRDYSEERIVRACEECGCTVYKLSSRGIPDLLVFAPKSPHHSRARAFLIEVKRSSKSDLTPDQKKFHQDAWRGEWPVFVVWNGDDVLGILNEVTR